MICIKFFYCYVFVTNSCAIFIVQSVCKVTLFFYITKGNRYFYFFLSDKRRKSYPTICYTETVMLLDL